MTGCRLWCHTVSGMEKDRAAFVSAVLLGAGKSERMGRPKLLLPFDGDTILGRTVDNLLGSRVDEVILVLGAGASEKQKAIAGRPLRVVVNRDYRRGMSTSLITGLKLVDARAQRVMVALSDQPLVDSETYSRLAEASLGSDKGIVLPVYRGARGNPIVFSMGYREELLGLSGDIGGREVVARHPDDVLEVAVNSEGVIININTMADYYSRLPGEAKLGGNV